MAEAIAGAVYGRSGIPDQLAEICEGVKDAEEQAEKLHQIATVRTSGGNQWHWKATQFLDIFYWLNMQVDVKLFIQDAKSNMNNKFCILIFKVLVPVS